LPSPHEFYKFITEKTKGIAIWVKPTKSMRIYGSGEFIGHIMGLRDAWGWAVRNISDIIEYVKKRTTSIDFFKKNLQPKIEKCVLYPCILLSEEKRGGSIYFIKEDKWKNLELESKYKYSLQNYNKNIMELEEPEIYCYLHQDGSMVVGEDGKLLAVGNYFAGPGGRRYIAEFMTALYGVASFIVSQDGGMYFFSPEIPPEESAWLKPEREKEMKARQKEKGKWPCDVRVRVGEFVRLDFFSGSCEDP
jgi:hypothetical protein